MNEKIGMAHQKNPRAVTSKHISMHGWGYINGLKITARKKPLYPNVIKHGN